MGEMVEKDSNLKLLTIRQFAEIVAISPKTLYRLVEEGKIPCIRIGRNIRFSPDMIDQMRTGGEK